MEKTDIKITTIEKVTAFLHLFVFYILLFGVFMALTSCLTINFMALIRGKAVSLAIVIIGTVIWGLYIFGLLFKKKMEFGLKKGRVELPHLFEVLDEVSLKTGSLKIDEISLAPNTMIGIYDDAGIWAFLGKSEIVFVLGIASLSGITVDELKVTIAHEFAHFSQKFDKLTVHLYRALLSLRHYSRNINHFSFKMILPTYYFLLVFNDVYPLLFGSFAKKCELLADKLAAEAYGSATFKNALISYSVESILFENNAYGNMEKLHENQLLVKNIYQSFEKFKENVTHEQKEKLKEALLKQENPGKFTPYPSIRERIDLAESYGYKNQNPDVRVAISIFKHRNRLEKELTNHLNKIILKIEENKKENMGSS